MGSYVGRAVGWLAASSALLVGGFLLLGAAAVASGLLRAGAELSGLQGVVWRVLFERVVLEALLPHLLATLASWLLLVRLAPSLDRSWGALLGGLPLTALLWFPVVGEFSFRIWTPTSGADYLNTLLLMSGGVSLALLLPRRILRPLGPGGLAPGPPGSS